MKLRIRKPLKTAMLATVAACLLAQTASAAVYVIRKDPAYGSAFPDLGWRASAELFVSDTCLSSVGLGLVTVTLGSGLVPTGCGASQINNTQLEFYNVANIPTTLETVAVGSYVADSLPAGSGMDLSQELLTLTFLGGEVLDFETSYSDPALVNPADGGYGNIAGGANTFFALNLSLNVVGAGDGKDGGLRSFTKDGLAYFEISGGASTVQSTDTLIRRVPEPGTLALALAALAGAFSLGRRRSRRAPR